MTHDVDIGRSALADGALTDLSIAFQQTMTIAKNSKGKNQELAEGAATLIRLAFDRFRPYGSQHVTKMLDEKMRRP